MKIQTVVAAATLALGSSGASALESWSMRGAAALQDGPARPCEVLNERPVIGVMTEAAEDGDGEYIAGSYVKWLEAAGARVVAVRYTSSDEVLREQFESMNGMLFPGGAMDLEPGKPFFDASEKIFKWAVEANKAGTYFPVWGTCLGYELLSILGAGSNSSVMNLSGYFDAENYPSPVKWTASAERSELFQQMPPYLRRAITERAVTFNAHTHGVTPEIYADNSALSGFFMDVATWKDRKGKSFVAMSEGRDGMPFYGLQFHPEKAEFEWFLPSAIPHQPEAIELARYFADFFVARARCNSHKYPSFKAAGEALVQTTARKHQVHPNEYFAETYVF